MKLLKRRLALATAIALLAIFGVETIAVAAPNTMPGTVITNNDCGGDKDDDC